MNNQETNRILFFLNNPSLDKQNKDEFHKMHTTPEKLSGSNPEPRSNPHITK